MTETGSLEVCFLINDLDTGGAQTLIRNMIEISDRPNTAYTVCYVGGRDEMRSEFEALDVTVVSLGARTETPQFDPRPPVRSLRDFDEGDFDVVHSHLPYSLILGRLIGRQTGAGIVSTHHSIKQNYHPVERTLERATRRYDDATVFVSDAVASSFGSRDGSRATTVYNGIDAGEFNDKVTRADGDGVRAELGVTDETLILNVGHCSEEKRQLDLVRSVGRIVDQRSDPDLHLAVVGDGPVRSRLEAAVADCDLGDYVSIVGRVPPSDIYGYYAAADVYAHVSEYEGMPMTLLEAMAAELPLVGAASPGIEEFIDDGRTGRLVETGETEAIADALVALTDPDVRSELGEQAFQTAETEYDIERTTEVYHSLYEEIAPAGTAPEDDSELAATSPSP